MTLVEFIFFCLSLQAPLISKIGPVPNVAICGFLTSAKRQLSSSSTRDFMSRLLHSFVGGELHPTRRSVVFGALPHRFAYLGFSLSDIAQRKRTSITNYVVMKDWVVDGLYDMFINYDSNVDSAVDDAWRDGSSSSGSVGATLRASPLSLRNPLSSSRTFSSRSKKTRPSCGSLSPSVHLSQMLPPSLQLGISPRPQQRHESLSSSSNSLHDCATGTDDGYSDGYGAAHRSDCVPKC